MVLVFKTSVKTLQEAKSLKPTLDQLLASSSWYFDLEDCDNILRVESNKNIASFVIEKLAEFGLSISILKLSQNQ
jgi:hypothetical protein